MGLELWIRVVGLLCEGAGLCIAGLGLLALRKHARHLKESHVLNPRVGKIRADPPPYVTWEALEASERTTEEALHDRDRESRTRDADVLAAGDPPGGPRAATGRRRGGLGDLVAGNRRLPGALLVNALAGLLD